jgi:hypothetical protein
MLTGMSPLIYPTNQPQPLQTLLPNNSYFLIQLHAVQVYFATDWLTKPGFVTISSSIGTSSIREEETKSLHQVVELKKNVPSQIGFRVNLTDWLPAADGDAVRITLNYIVTKATPFKDLAGKIDQVDLVAKASLVRPELAVAAKVSQITGHLLSFLLEEGKTRRVFDLKMDQNIVDLKAGYYVIFGSADEVPNWPTEVSIDDQGRLSGESELLKKLNYALFKVFARPRRGEEIARGEPWWELLQTAKDQVLNIDPINDEKRLDLLNQWRTNIAQVRTLARKEKGYLLTEIDDILGQTSVKVQEHLSPIIREGDLELPEDLQEILGVRTEQELYDSVQHYEQALELSQELLEQYEL